MTAISRRAAVFGLLATTSLALAGCGADAGGFRLPTSAGMNEEYTRGFVMDDALIAQVLTVVDQNVLVIYFNKSFKVERIANYGLKDGVIFDFISRTTATGGEEQSFLRNLFRGVTKFTPFGA
jgi:hypothetical protein